MNDMNNEDERYWMAVRRDLNITKADLAEALSENSKLRHELAEAREENLALLRTIAAVAARNVKQQLDDLKK
jgi:hypothetical protein